MHRARRISFYQVVNHLNVFRSARTWRMLLIALCLAGCDNGQSDSPSKSMEYQRVQDPNTFSELLNINSDLNKMLHLWKIGMQTDFAPEGNVFDCLSCEIGSETFSTLLRRKTEWIRIAELKLSSEEFQQLCQIKSLIGLSLNGSDLTDLELRRLNELSSLRWLDLSYSALPRNVTGPLFANPELETLSLATSRFSDSHAFAMAQNARLRSLSVAGSSVTDSGINAIVDSNPNLEVLDLLACNGITLKSTEALVKLSALKYLVLCGTAFANDDAGESLRQLDSQLQNCVVVVFD